LSDAIERIAICNIGQFLACARSLGRRSGPPLAQCCAAGILDQALGTALIRWRMDEFDYIVVGAGSAGCVLASRLTEDGKSRVLLLEFGGSDRSVLIQMPGALSIPMNMPKYNWGFATEPEPHLGGRRLATPRGKVLGGSSSINGMVWVRGNPLDFDGWEEQGAEGWGYRHVLPYFRRADGHEGGDPQYRASDGPLYNCYGRLDNPLHHAWLQAAQQAGYPATPDCNGYQQEGFGRLAMSVHRGRRWSTANAYLRPALPRRNLRIVTHARATRVLFSDRRAVGVAYRRGGKNCKVHAAREVILAAGAINSPQLLKLSGVGPAAELHGLGIDVVRDLRGVGENLQDHLEFYFQIECREPITLYSAMGPLAKAWIGMRWLLRHDGRGATNHFETGGFIRSRAGVRYPDLQYHFLPLAVAYDGKSLLRGHGFQAHIGPMRSQSRGWVRLASADPAEAPRIRFNYMSHPDDWIAMRAAVRLTREIFAQPAFNRYRGREIQPGDAVRTDAEIDAFAREKVESAYHPCGSCRMGRADDPRAVVDPECRVIGLDGLRVIDSSIMPTITTGNLNAPTIMIGEKGADHVRGHAPLPAANVPVYVAAKWQAAQR
jgi:choline dehydrogenase